MKRPYREFGTLLDSHRCESTLFKLGKHKEEILGISQWFFGKVEWLGKITFCHKCVKVFMTQYCFIGDTEGRWLLSKSDINLLITWASEQRRRLKNGLDTISSGDEYSNYWGGTKTTTIYDDEIPSTKAILLKNVKLLEKVVA